MDTVHTTTEFGIGGAWLAEYTLASIGAGVVLFDASGHAAQWDPTAPALLCVTEQELAGRALHDDGIAAIWQQGDRLTVDDDPVAAVLESGETMTGITIGVVDDNGSRRWRSVVLLPVFGIDHRPRAVLASFVDVSATIESRTTSSAWHLAMRSMLQAGLPAIILVNRRGEILEWNEQVLDLTDRTEVELLGCRFADVCDVDVEWLWTELDGTDGGGVEGMTWMLHRLDREIAVHGRFSALDHPDYGTVAMAQLLAPTGGETADDGPERRGASAVFERSLVPMLMITDTGTIVDANPSASSMLCQPRSALVGGAALAHFGGIAPDDLHRAIAHARVSPEPISVGRCATRAGGGRVSELTVFVSSTALDAPSPLLLVQLLGVTEPDTPPALPFGGRPLH